LYVKGVTPELLFGEDFNLNGRLEPNENDGDQTWPPDNRDGKLDPGFWSMVTIWSSDRNVDAQGTKRVNLNTAAPQQLVVAGLNAGEAQAVSVQRLLVPFFAVAQLLGDPARGLNPIMTTARFKLVVDKLTVLDDA